MSIPSLPLWMVLAASIPSTWGPITSYFAITLILSIIGWTDLARVVRGRFLALREEDFVESARRDNARTLRIMRRHMLPTLRAHTIRAPPPTTPRTIPHQPA